MNECVESVVIIKVSIVIFCTNQANKIWQRQSFIYFTAADVS